MKNGALHSDVVGLMSGTSLDGLDLCCVHFDFDGKWRYRIIKAESVDYPEEMRRKLATAQSMTALEYARLHSDYGLYLGEQVKAFLERNHLEVDLIASHGQTVFHQPSVRFTGQIGSGAGIAAVTGIDTVCDFRTTDVALGGQGAPLVPIGDSVLFGDYAYCLNLGGFSNISFASGERRLAFDISPVNYVLNHYAGRVGQTYDRDGAIARSGHVCDGLLSALNSLPFYTQQGPKSLGREWVEAEVFPLIESYRLPVADVLATFVEHVAVQVGRNVRGGRVLVTGGGARNVYLVERMQALAPQAVYEVPDALTIDFKEALIFALLGALYMADMPNCLSSVTGASRDNIGGCLYKGNRI
ncbi:MAG: anhydro-N-acetylmuramic acid kinase [Bacteroidales bacterium]|nr:anhydro-N-acetylmuramic acid kinase [Bacteroidales bacterium]